MAGSQSVRLSHRPLHVNPLKSFHYHARNLNYWSIFYIAAVAIVCDSSSSIVRAASAVLFQFHGRKTTLSKEMQRIADVKEAELVSVLASLPDDVFLKLVTDAGLLEEDTDAGKEESK